MCTSHRRLFYVLALVLLIVGCDSSSGPDDPELPPIASIRIVPDNRPLLPKGQGVQLLVTVTAEDGTVVTDPPIRWSSSDDAVVTVSESGMMRGQQAGQATITASVDNKSAEVIFRVFDLSGTWMTSFSFPNGTTGTATFALAQNGTNLTGTMSSPTGLFGNGVGQEGTFSGTLLWDKLAQTLVVNDPSCNVTITGNYFVRMDEDADLFLEEEPDTGFQSGDNCNLNGPIMLPTLLPQ